MTSENQNQRIIQVIFSAQTTLCPELQNKYIELAFSIKNDIFFHLNLKKLRSVTTKVPMSFGCSLTSPRFDFNTFRSLGLDMKNICLPHSVARLS